MLVKTGCCGIRQAISKYTANFPVVEVQHTFYQPPKITTLLGWRSQAPDNFEFTIKAWQLITHEPKSPTYRRLKRHLTEAERRQCGAFRWNATVREAWETTLACARALRANRILFQCPASFTPTRKHIQNLRKFFLSLNRPVDLRLLWEPRGEWPAQLLQELCIELRLVHVVDPFVNRSVTPEHSYFRLHGRNGFRYSYEESELEELLGMLPRHTTSYVLFNNVRMLENAASFQKLTLERR